MLSKQINIGIPEDVHAALKLAASDREITLHELYQTIFKEWLECEENEKIDALGKTQQ